MIYLDYCCGIGDSTRDMIQKVPRDSDIRVVGIDMNPVNVAIARRRHSPLVSFYHGSLPEMRIPKESVDLIQMKCSLIGLLDKERHLQEIYRILKPKGIFLVIQEQEHMSPTTRSNDNLLLNAIFEDCCERWVQDDQEYRLYMK
jgi:demethylmenaquinone methyltransferase/2-methoxy-6-polyprenyl-1,4-benzoquinol methylase